MRAFNYAQNPKCVICKKPIGRSSNHAACSKKKQALHREAQQNPTKVLEQYPQFFIGDKRE